MSTEWLFSIYSPLDSPVWLYVRKCALNARKASTLGHHVSFPHAVWRNVCFRVCGEYVVCRRNWKIPGQTTDFIVEMKTSVITRHDHAWLNNTIFPYTPLRTKQNENTKLVCASATPFTVRPPAAPVTSSRALAAVSSACSLLSALCPSSWFDHILWVKWLHLSEELSAQQRLQLLSARTGEKSFQAETSSRAVKVQLAHSWCSRAYQSKITFIDHMFRVQGKMSRVMAIDNSSVKSYRCV